MKTITPTSISLKQIEENDFSLSPSNYASVLIKNNNVFKLRDLLDRELNSSDKGFEIGSNCYIGESPYKFMRTKTLQAEFLLPQIDEVSTMSILPTCFKKMTLQEGDILISKDSNIGEVAILDRNYENYMMSGGLYKLPVSKNKHYLFGLLKTDFFKKQLHILVSRGSTLKHAKTLFLDCRIPFPQDDKVVDFVESLVKSLINKEKIIKEKKILIEELIEKELFSKQRNSSYKYNYPTQSELLNNSRLDTGTYTDEFKTIDYQIKNYSGGFFLIPEKDIQSGNTPSKRFIGESSVYDYLWITPTSITDYGTIQGTESIRCDINNLNRNALLVINRTSRGSVGEYVGVTAYYDFIHFGKGHHNQGIYRIENYPDTTLMFMSCCMNSILWRKYCAGLSLGSKMKEIKTTHLASIPFPNFPESKVGEIADLYHKVPDERQNFQVKNPQDYLRYDGLWNQDAGIFQVYESYLKIKRLVEKIVVDITNDDSIKIVFSIKDLY